MPRRVIGSALTGAEPFDRVRGPDAADRIGAIESLEVALALPRSVRRPSVRFTAAAALLAGSAAAGCGDDPGTPVADADIDASGDVSGDVAPDGGDVGIDTAPDVDAADGSGGSDTDAADVAEDVIPSGNLQCEVTTAGSISPEAGLLLEVDVEGGATGLAVEWLGREVETATAASIACADGSMLPEGFTALSPIYGVGSDDTVRFGRNYFVTAPFDRSLMPDGARASSIRVFWRPRGDAAATQPLLANVQENMVRGTLRFETDLTGEFQIAVADDAGTPVPREWAFRAITGVSMGASGSSMIALRHPELFDIVAPLGGPTDWTFLAHYIRVGGMGGFNPAPTFGRAPLYTPTEQLEHPQAYDEWWFPAGEGTGGSFNRSDYAKIFLDLMMTFGNIVTYNDESPYAAPGLPLSELARAASERCSFTAECTTNEGVFTIETGYYDDEFNPDGSLPVITFCDGQGSRDADRPFARACDINFDGRPDETNEGLYDNPCRQDRPIDITFAVDVNGNGMRDPGEPIVVNFHEPYEDVGTDGVASADEEGFDAVLAPDPAGDDFDPFTNPFGTEGNHLYDEGEPYEDHGLDGVDGTPQLADGGYDWGEDNGRFDYNPNLEELLFERNPTQRLIAEPELLERLTFFLDAGVRDLFNFGVAANFTAGTIQGLGGNVRAYDQFYAVADLLESNADDYNFTEVDYANLGQNVLLRYGSLDASAEDICFGDGKHVGTVEQIANRLLTMLGFVTNRFPDGETTVVPAPYPLPSGTFYTDSPSTGTRVKYSVAFPPGFEATQCTDGTDNDGDGLKDGEDPDCTHALILSEGGATDVTRCTDGIDNDADGLPDDRDPDCTGGDGLSEWPMDFPMRDATFPVVFILHGYGQSPEDLQVTAVPFSGFMAQGIWPKVILVFPDGYCGTVDVTQCSDGTDNDGDELVDRADPDCAASGGRSETGEALRYCDDGVDNDLDGVVDLEDGGCVDAAWDTEANCLRGNFYADHAAWPSGEGSGPAYESMFLDLIDHLDEVYPTRAPETISVVP